METGTWRDVFNSDRRGRGDVVPEVIGRVFVELFGG